MKMLISKTKRLSLVLVAMVLAFGVSSTAQAVIDGITGTTFNLTAKTGRISTADGNSVYFWGLADDSTGQVQYPAPTLILNQGDAISVTLTNNLPAGVDTSIIFPGQEGVTSTANLDGTTTYNFTASHAGTYLYNSGTDMDLQIEMGLVGAIIVKPPQAGQAYNHADSTYNREFLYLMTEVDLEIHEAQEKMDGGGILTALELTELAKHRASPRYEYWLLNGRTAVDTLFPSAVGGNAAWLPTQPYNSLPLMHPGDKLLLRVISAGRDGHPLHTHGNNALIIAKDGRMLSDGSTAGSDKAYSDNTFMVMPGSTWDIVFEWTGAGMGWDIYNHGAETPCNANTLLPFEDADSHCKPFPVSLPGNQDLTMGGFWSGSPFLGNADSLPPGEGGLNPFDGYFFPWHSHHEKELTNFDIYPGGILTFFAVVPLDFPLPLPY